MALEDAPLSACCWSTLTPSATEPGEGGQEEFSTWLAIHFGSIRFTGRQEFAVAPEWSPLRSLPAKTAIGDRTGVSCLAVAWLRSDVNSAHSGLVLRGSSAGSPGIG